MALVGMAKEQRGLESWKTIRLATDVDKSIGRISSYESSRFHDNFAISVGESGSYECSYDP
jgi:hypothetical protein